ncbi:MULTISPECIES: hypothetical protein [Burkholderia]|uniref:hypothetical protein n=1 Tax=Burkholderia TaxID=32008 RepID=UPI00075D5DE1|nr:MULTISPECIES: hypothetical protein [Burkholderia]KVH03460.1 hypothetical protein WS85_30155 [Burkholderia anthina]KVH05148.1 hypothetical protein WS84_26660 [Burkholderia anthina]KVM98085.1 hypothetical protein WT06_02745 [Burkholderia anthina]KVN51293.1 hypothetical protein WT13_02025 [Burkholderia anthina]KVX37247.1 hypothetical protein WT32_11165 [Burkholderia anthina]
MASGWGARAAIAIGGVLPGAAALAVTLARHYPGDGLNRLYAAVLMTFVASVAALLWVLVAPGWRQAAWRAGAWLAVLVPCAVIWGGR